MLAHQCASLVDGGLSDHFGDVVFSEQAIGEQAGDDVFARFEHRCLMFARAIPLLLKGTVSQSRAPNRVYATKPTNSTLWPNKPLKLTPLRGPKIAGILKSRRSSNAFPIYRCGAAKRQALGDTG